MNTHYNQKRQIDWKKRRQQYLLGSLVCLAAALFLYSKRNDLIPKERLVSLGVLTLLEKPAIDKEPGKYGDKYLKLVFSEIKKPLKISGTDYYCLDKKSLLDYFNKGDTLQVWVDKNDFKNNLIFQGERVYGLIARQKNYCDLNCRNKSFKYSQKIGAVAFGSLAIGCLIAGLLPAKPRLRVLKYKTYDIEPLGIIILLTAAIMLMAKTFL